MVKKEKPWKALQGRVNPIFLTISFIVLLIAIWQLFFKSSIFIALPNQVIASMPSTWPDYLGALKSTIVEFISSLLLSIAFGVPIGFLIAWKDGAFRTLNPLLGIALVTPKIAFVPLITLWLGISGNSSAVALGVLLGIFPIIVNTIAGLRATNQEYLPLARSIGLSQVQIFRKIILPSFYPFLFVGMFLASSLCMTGVLLMEMVLEHPGVGYLILYYSNEYLTSRVYAASVFTIMVTLSISGSLWYLSKHFEQRNASSA